MQLHSCLLVSAIALVTLGCSDNGKTPSKDNFAKVIQQSEYSDQCHLLTPPPPFKGDFPVTLELDDSRYSIGTTSLPKYDALTAAGLLQVEDGEISRRVGPREVQIRTRTYSLTDVGTAALRSGEANSFSGRARPGFCVTSYKVDEVKHYTEPSDAFGMTASQVSYTYSPDKTSDWATHPAVLEAFPDIETALTPARSDSAMLVLTSEGWMNGKDLK